MYTIDSCCIKMVINWWVHCQIVNCNNNVLLINVLLSDRHHFFFSLEYETMSINCMDTKWVQTSVLLHCCCTSIKRILHGKYFSFNVRNLTPEIECRIFISRKQWKKNEKIKKTFEMKKISTINSSNAPLLTLN